MSSDDHTKSAARAWIGAEQRLGFRVVRPILAMNLLGTMLAIGQVFAVSVLLTGRDFATFAGLFAALAVARAGLSYTVERLAFGAGASARRRLRTDLLGRLLAAGPAMLRTRHSVELTAIVVDRVEALDGLFSRYIPAALFALGGPVVVLIAVVAFDPGSASICFEEIWIV